MTRPREVTRKRSPRRTFAMYSGSFCRSSVTLTCFMRAPYVQMKCTDGKAAFQVSRTRSGAAVQAPWCSPSRATAPGLVAGPWRKRLDLYRQRRRLGASPVLGGRLLRALAPALAFRRLGGVGFRFPPEYKTLTGGDYGRLHIAGERNDSKGIFGRARHAAPVRPAQRPRAERPEVRLRARPMRRVHRADRRQVRAFVLGAGVVRGEGSDHHARGTRHDRQAPPAAARFHRGAGLPVRLLQQRNDHGRQGAASQQSPPERGRDQAGLERAPVPLRLAQPHRSRGAARGKGDGMKPSLSRRDFLKTGSALVISFSLAPELAFGQAKPAPLPGSLGTNRMLDSRLRVDAHGSVTLFTGKIELGQGIGTALTQIAADELDVDLKRIRIVHGDTALTPNEGQTAGSQSVENSGTAVRFACAEARDILVNAAAAKLGVAASALSVSDGTCTAGGKSIAYWDLVADANLKREASAKIKPKSASEHKWGGKSVLRRDIPKKMTAGAASVQDVRLPGMVFGRVVRPPSPGAQLVSFDEAAVKRMPGVIAVVRDGSFLGVAAEREEQAIRARELLKESARWKESASLPPSGDGLFEHLMTQAKSVDSVVSEKTSATAAAPAKTLNATYTRPFQVHGSIGPSCAVAQWREGKLTVWTHSQGVFPLRGDLAKVFATDPANVHCIHAQGAGRYGHNGADDVALARALVARATGGRPVKLQWMRDDEFQWEPYGSANAMKLSGGLDAQGNVVSWTHEVWSHPHNNRPGAAGGVNLLASWHLAKPSKVPFPVDPPQPTGGADRNSIPLYDFPNQKVVKHFLPEMPLRTSALRTLGGYSNVFALESFVDELALAAGGPPAWVRRRLLEDPRGRAVIEAAAQRAAW